MPHFGTDHRLSLKSMVGSQVASREFLSAMMRYLPDAALFADDAVVKGMQADVAKNLSWRNAQVFSLSAMPLLLRTSFVRGLHSFVPGLDKMTYTRAKFAANIFPLTCLTHGLSQQDLIWSAYATIWTAPLLPCDSVICTSNAARIAIGNLLDQTEQGFREVGVQIPQKSVRLDVVPLGVDTDVFQPRDSVPARALLGLQSEDTILLVFGRISAESKCDLTPFLRVFSTLAKQHAGLKLVIAGAAALSDVAAARRAAHLTECEDRVLVVANPTEAEGPLYYAAADVVICLSDTLQESFGLSPLEAMACGKPVVAPAWSGYRETILHQQTGFLVDTLWGRSDGWVSELSPVRYWMDDHFRISQSVAMNLDQMHRYLLHLIENPDLRAEMGQRARRHVLDNYHWRRVMSLYNDLLDELNRIAKPLSLPKEYQGYLHRPAYYRNFGHFASASLDAECAVYPASLFAPPGKERHLLLSSGAGSAYSQRMLWSLIRYIKRYATLEKPLPVATLQAVFENRYQTSGSMFLAHLLWCIKYGYVAVAEHSPDQSLQG